MSSPVKKIILFVVIFILAVVGYVVFFGGDTSSDALLTTNDQALGSTESVSQTGVGREFLTSLLNIKNIKLNDSIFSNPSFSNLQDFTITLVEQPSGRPNPFAPVGSDQTTSSTPTTPTPTTPEETTNPPEEQIQAQLYTREATSITKTAAVLNGEIIGTGSSARWFEWGKTQSLGTTTTSVAQTNAGVFSQPISSLAPNTTYYFRAVSQIKGIRNAGAISTFTTSN